MTVTAVLSTFSGVLSAALVIVGVIEIRTGRTRVPNGRWVTNVTAHGWMLIATAGYCAGLVVVGLLDRPSSTLAVMVVGLAAMSACSVVAYRRPRAAPPPARGKPPLDPVTVEELFRRHREDREPG